YLVTKDGKPAQFSELTATQQTLELWSGTLRSMFTFEGHPIQIETSVHPTLDMLIVKIHAPAFNATRLGMDLKFPGIAAQLNPNPADWDHPDRHRTHILQQDARHVSLQRDLDDTRYFVEAASDEDVTFRAVDTHTLRVIAREGDASFNLKVLFSPERNAQALP